MIRAPLVAALPAALDWRRVGNVTALTLLILWGWWMMTTLAPTFVTTDAYSYWSVTLGPDLYATPVGERTAFLYSPLVAQLIAPLTALPYEAFYALILALNTAALVYLLGPMLALVSLAFPPVPLELAVGNIHLLLGAAIVAGFRHRGWWAVLPLTKVTPSVVWLYDPPRQWLWPLGVTLGLAALSAVVAPDLWVAWVQRLANPTRSIPDGFEFLPWPLWLRLGLAFSLVLLARWRCWPWLLPVAAVLALPVIWTNSLALLVACWPCRRTGWRTTC